MDTTLVLLEHLKNTIGTPYAVLVFAIAYVASEVIGSSKLKSNGIVSLIFNIAKEFASIVKRKGK